MNTLNVYSIFYSIQGESTYAGLPCVFIRLAGCRADCTFCDTGYALAAPGKKMTFDLILDEIGKYGVNLVEITGGEPLEQKETPFLLSRLADEGYDVLLETNGVHSIKEIDPRVEIIMDIKTPGFGCSEAFFENNLNFINDKKIQIKFVVTSKTDFEYAIDQIKKANLTEKCTILISPVDTLEKATLADWILETGMPVRLHLQQHKIIWPLSTKEC
jgi:7-carboxy-7-deazaguanine synthase